MKTVLKTVGTLLLAAIGAIIGALVNAVRFLASAADTVPADDKLGSSVRGGVLNYRTGKLDDGTDPYGWYDRN